MRNYELIIMINPINKEKIKDLIVSINYNLKKNKGKIHNIKEWGVKRLAYKINNIIDAYYMILFIKCNLDSLLSIQKYIKFNTNILRFLILRKKEIKIDINLNIKKRLLINT